MLPISLSYVIFCILKYIPSISSFFRINIIKGCWILSKLFLYLLRWSCDLCPGFYFMQYYIYWFACADLSLNSRDKTNLIIIYDFEMCRLIQFASILLRIFGAMFIKVIGL
jgi:hypothetical protein